MNMDNGYAAVHMGRQLLFHNHRNCSTPAIEQFPTGLFTLEQRLHGALIVHILTAIYIIAALGVIAHEYFVPAMEKLLTITKIDPNIAGTAVMATAASTPQLATAIIGVFVTKSDIGVGAVVGSSYFNIFFIVGLCALVSKEPLRLSWWPVFRDIFFYILAASVLAILLVDQQSTWWNGLVLVLVYGVYIVALIFNSRLEHAVTKLVSCMRLGFSSCRCKVCRDKKDCEQCGLVDGQGGNKKVASDPNSNDSDVQSTETPQEPMYQTFDKGSSAAAESGDSESVEEYHSVLSRPAALWKQVLWFLLLPALLVIFLLIPDCRRPNSWRYLFILTIMMSVVVIGFSAYILVWMVATIGSTIGISDTVMGLTFLAVGASVPDMLNAVFVAQHGYGDMAVSNCIGSNIFDVLICLGLPWFLDVLFARRTYPLKIEDDVSTISITLIASAFILFCCVFITNWRINKVLGGLLIAAYAVFITFTALFSNHTALPACETTV